jgi:hypothetical protein
MQQQLTDIKALFPASQSMPVHICSRAALLPLLVAETHYRPVWPWGGERYVRYRTDYALPYD